MWHTGVNSHNEIQDGSKRHIDKKGSRLMVGACQCPGPKGRWRAVHPPWTIYAFIHQSREHEAASWHNGCCSHTLSLISPRTLKVKNITVMIMHCLFIRSNICVNRVQAKPSLLGWIKTPPHMHARRHHRQLKCRGTFDQIYITLALFLQCFHTCKVYSIKWIIWLVW